MIREKPCVSHEEFEQECSDCWTSTKQGHAKQLGVEAIARECAQYHNQGRNDFEERCCIRGCYALTTKHRLAEQLRPENPCLTYGYVPLQLHLCCDHYQEFLGNSLMADVSSCLWEPS